MPGAGGADSPRWRLLAGLFFTGWTLMYANRTLLSAALDVLQREWSAAAGALGLVNSVFFLAYALMQVPAGILGDRYSRRAVLLGGWFLQAAGTLAGALSAGLGSFAAARFAAGLGQGTYYATQYALAATSVPPGRRARVLAFINSGMSAGILAGWGAGGLLLYRLGVSWRSAFLGLGVFTAAVGVLLAAGVREERRGAAAPARAGETTSPSPAGGVPGRAPGGRVLGLACATSFCSMYAFYVFLTWLPYYLQAARHLEGGEAGLVAALVPALSIPAGLLAAAWSERAGPAPAGGRAADGAPAGGGRGEARRSAVLVLLLPASAAAVLLVGLVPGRTALYAGVVLYGLTGKLVVDPLLLAEVAAAAPGEAYARVFGILNLASTVPTFLAPAVTGWLVDLTGGFRAAFLLATALLAAGTAAAAGLGRVKLTGGP